MLTNKRQYFAYIVLFLCSVSAYAWEFEVELTEQELQQRFTPSFPAEFQQAGFGLKFKHPEVALKDNSERIFLGLQTELSSMGVWLGEAYTQLSGELHYVDKTATFYLHQPRIEQFESHQLDPQLAPMLKEVLNLVSQQMLNRIPVYTLDEKDFQQRMLKKRLRGVHVREKKLVIVMQLD